MAIRVRFRHRFQGVPPGRWRYETFKGDDLRNYTPPGPAYLEHPYVGVEIEAVESRSFSLVTTDSHVTAVTANGKELLSLAISPGGSTFEVQQEVITSLVLRGYYYPT